MPKLTKPGKITSIITDILTASLLTTIETQTARQVHGAILCKDIRFNPFSEQYWATCDFGQMLVIPASRVFATEYSDGVTVVAPDFFDNKAAM